MGQGWVGIGLRDKSPETPASATAFHEAAQTDFAPAQILRYSVLGLGVVYGFYHQRTITSTQKAAAAQRDYEHKQQLINKAKDAYARSKQPAASASSSSSGRGFSLFLVAPTTGLPLLTPLVVVNQDLNSPNLDLEALLEGFLNQK